MGLVYKEQLEISGDRGVYCCDWKYIEGGHWGVFEKTLQGAGANPQFKLVKCNRSPGYLNQSYPDVEMKYELLSEREMTLDEIRAILISEAV